jgi:hypothetical protein
MYDKSDSFSALHRRAVRLSKPPNVIAALVWRCAARPGSPEANPESARPGRVIES